MGFIFNYIMDNAFEVDAKAQEEKLREKEPNLLDPRETIEFAFKEARDTRDKSYFTSHRILIKDGKGIGKKRRNFKSIPYECVQDFSITTAGAIDDDIEVIIKTTGSFTHDITIAKKQCDIYALQQYLAARVTQFYQAEGSQEEIIPVNVANAGDAGTFLSFFNNDASSFSPSEVENKFKTDTPVLLQNESVEMAFKTGRDFFIFTSLRLFIVDVQGLTGKQIQFQSIAWSALSSITIETAGGAFDRDTELILHTSMPGKDIIEIEFRKSQVSVFQVARSLANKLLGPDLEPLEEVEANKTGVMATVSGWFNRADNKPLEADEVNIMLHEHFPLLQGSEKVELAFGARGDMLVFTTKRLVIVDPTGRLRRKGRTEYTSIPYKNIVAFAVETASGMMDNDTELMIWTDMNFIPPEIKDGEQVEPPQPGMSFMEFDFNKKLVDIIGLKKYLGDRVLKSQKVEAAPMKPDIGMGSNESTMGNFFSNFGDNQRPIDPIEVNESLHSQTPLLLDDEVVIMAFRAGRDLSVFSNYRVIVIDVQVRLLRFLGGWKTSLVGRNVFQMKEDEKCLVRSDIFKNCCRRRHLVSRVLFSMISTIFSGTTGLDRKESQLQEVRYQKKKFLVFNFGFPFHNIYEFLTPPHPTPPKIFFSLPP